MAFQDADGVLEVVFRGGGDADLIALDRGLDLLQLLVLQELDDLLRRFARDALRRSILRLTVMPVAFSTSPSFMFFTGTFRRIRRVCRNLPDGVQLERVLGRERQRVLAAVEDDFRRRPLKSVRCPSSFFA